MFSLSMSLMKGDVSVRHGGRLCTSVLAIIAGTHHFGTGIASRISPQGKFLGGSSLKWIEFPEQSGAGSA